MTHFFGDAATKREADDPAPADPPFTAPQTPGAPANPIAIAEPTEPPPVDRSLTYDDEGNVEQANVNYGQVEAPVVAGGAQPHFSNDPKPADARRSAVHTHQPVGDLREQAAAKRTPQQAPKKATKKKAR